MDNDREIDQVMMSIRGSSGAVIGAMLFSTKVTLQLMLFLARLVKKGVLAAKAANSFKDFTKLTDGKYTVYNIPLDADKAKMMVQLNALELNLQKERNPLKRKTIQSEIKEKQKALPEIEQLNKLNISHCVLPKLNGSDSTVQIAVANKDNQLFKNWFLNHLTGKLSGGQKDMEEIKVFTEGNYTIFNLPFEGEELQDALPDFDKLGMNYALLPDLKIGDNNSQIAVPNADQSKLHMWFKMWKDMQIKDGKEPGEMYEMNQESYMNTSTMEADEYIDSSKQEYKDINAEYENQAQNVPWQAGVGRENSEEYVRLLQDSNYEKITINKRTLVKNMIQSDKTVQMEKEGYFVSRIPGTYNEDQETLVLPVNRVFRTDDDKTFVGFLPKNGGTMVADFNGNIKERNFEDAYAPYDKVRRNLHKVEKLQKSIAPKMDLSAKMSSPNK